MNNMSFFNTSEKTTGVQKYWSVVSGYILPLSWIVAIIILTSIGLWYQKITVQSFLAQRLIEQRGLFLECESLLPFLTEELEKLDHSELIKEKKDFIQIERPNRGAWTIDRSKWMDNKVQFIFRKDKEELQTIALTVFYKGNN